MYAVRVCVCVCACMRACVCACVCMNAHRHFHLCLYITYACMCAHVHLSLRFVSWTDRPENISGGPAHPERHQGISPPVVWVDMERRRSCGSLEGLLHSFPGKKSYFSK